MERSIIKIIMFNVFHINVLLMEYNLVKAYLHQLSRYMCSDLAVKSTKSATTTTTYNSYRVWAAHFYLFS